MQSSPLPTRPVQLGPVAVLDVLLAGPEDGRTVVLLHGFPQTSWSWRGVVPALVDAGFRVVAPDQRGYSPGHRPTDVAAYAMPELVGDVLALLDVLGVDRADVVGHDWGAAVAWQLAGRHPDRVRTLTALSVPHPLAFLEALMTDEDQRRRSQYMRDWGAVGTAEEQLLSGDLLRVFGDVPGVDVDRYDAHMREPGALTAALSWYRAQRREHSADAPAVTVPTLHVWSDGDPALGRRGTELTAQHVTGPYRLVELSGIGHWIPEQVPEQVSALLLEHLRTYEGTPG